MSQVRSGHLNRLRRFTVFGEGVQVLGVAGQELDQVGPLDLLRHSLVQQLDVVGEVVVVGVVGAGDLFEVVRTVGVRKALDQWFRNCGLLGTRQMISDGNVFFQHKTCLVVKINLLYKLSSRF
jgi:hypothetical protein